MKTHSFSDLQSIRPQLPQEADHSRSEVQYSIRHHLLVGAGVIILLAGGVGGWAATTHFSGAVIAQGQLVVDTNVKKVQHPTGGVVGELRVRDGQRVKAGDVVVRLDETQARANLGIIVKALDELAARRSRDEAERDGADTISFPPDLLARMEDPQVAQVVSGERRLFEIRRTALAGEKSLLRERIVQLNQEIKGIALQQDAREQQIEWIKKELVGVNALWEKNLVPYSKVTVLERDAARLTGERGQLIASIAQSRGRISELELQIIQLEQNMRAEVGKDLAEIRAKESELIEKRVAAEDLLKRVDIRAPQDGFVHQLSAHTVGGVIAPGEPIMIIVPDADALSVEAKIPPHDIDRIRLGHEAVLRFSAFNQHTTPELNGTVIRIAADVIQDQRSGAAFYTVRISLPEKEFARLGELKLVAGMPVEAFIRTGVRSVISYLVKPLHDQITRTFRER
jgi:HlyD family secretion protein